MADNDSGLLILIEDIKAALQKAIDAGGCDLDDVYEVAEDVIEHWAPVDKESV